MPISATAPVHVFRPPSPNIYVPPHEAKLRLFFNTVGRCTARDHWHAVIINVSCNVAGTSWARGQFCSDTALVNEVPPLVNA